MHAVNYKAFSPRARIENRMKSSPALLPAYFTQH